MKLFILVDELNYEPGIYGYSPIEIEEIESPIQDKLNKASQIIKPALGLSSGVATTAAALKVGATVLGSLSPLTLGISGALLAGSIVKNSHEVLKKNPTASQGEWGLQQSFENEDSEVLGYLNSSIIVHHNTMAGEYKSTFNKPEFYGSFKNHKQMEKVLETDGSNSEIIIMAVETAQKNFQHYGSGIFAPGKYIPHPKKLKVLVPFESFHSKILKEVDEEFVRLFSSLGAKKVNIQTIEGVSMSDSSVIPAYQSKLTAKFIKSKVAKKTYEFYPETCAPESALDDKVWIQDHPKMMTFWETRKSFKLKRFEETVDINTSFGLDINVMQQFDNNFKWKKKSKYRYEVEFFSKEELAAA
jgi:hypothetical protein